MNACGYHYMESGASPAEEIGFAIGNAMMVLDAVKAKVTPAQFETVVEQLSFFINSGIELVPEIAKVRAYARLWPRVCEEVYGIAGIKWRAGCQVRSLTLTEQSPENNIIRIAYEALPVVLSAGARVRALQLPGFREATGLPDAAEQALSLRTQQILMYETGITDHEDIFEGSVVIERETARVADDAWTIAHEIRAMGFQRSIARIAERLTLDLVAQQSAVEQGERVRVGINAFVGEIGIARSPAYEDDSAERVAGAARQLESLAAWRSARDAAAWRAAREALRDAARTDANLLPASIAFARAGGTTGEWTETLAEAFGGRFQAPIGADVVAPRPLSVPRAAQPYRVFLAKSGLDGHVNAVKLLAYACRQAGLEVIYSGLQQTPESIALGALQEGADVIGISCLSGAHLHVARSVLDALHRHGGGGLPVVMGGIIPERDASQLRAMGVAAVFTPKDGDIGAIVGTLTSLAEQAEA
jgi:(2R)-ethylmalonyl-CoA mutase